MQLEFLATGSINCPLIRIYGTDPAGFRSLQLTVQQLAIQESITCALHELPEIRAVAGCGLTMIASSANAGIRRIGAASRFEWELVPAKWSVVAGLIEPFARGLTNEAHQWLAGKEARFGLDVGTVSVLVSNSDDGRW